jgi:two-component system, LytTR family, sensor kinase
MILDHSKIHRFFKYFFASKIFVIVLNILGWAVFVGLSALIFKVQRHSQNHLFILSLVIIIFYVNVLFLIPKFLSKGRIMFYFTGVILILGIVYSTALIHDNFFDRDFPFGAANRNEYNLLADEIYAKIHSQQNITREEILQKITEYRETKRLSMPKRMILLTIFIFAISTGIKVTQGWIRNEKIRKEIDNERLNAELHFLKSQVNPHFLFNTLNSIYSLAYKRSEKTHDAIAKLSNILRYMLYETDVKTVSLESEYQYLMDYIDLQKLRLYSNTQIRFETQGDMSKIHMAPMLLVPFVENAFKHGTDNTTDCYINILLQVSNNDLFFKVENSIPSKVDNNNYVTSGIGLQNVKRRLKLLYPDQHLLLIDQSETNYCIKLTLRLFAYELCNS